MVKTKKSETGVRIDPVSLRQAVLKLRALCNRRFRERILSLLSDADHPLTVTEIYVALRLEQSVVSQHLAILRRAGFVEATRHGKNIAYTINVPEIAKANKILEKLAEGTSAAKKQKRSRTAWHDLTDE